MKFLIYIIISLEIMQGLFPRVIISAEMDTLVLFFPQIQMHNFGIGLSASYLT